VFVTQIAGVAQLAEQRICNPQVTGSSPIASSSDGLHKLQKLYRATSNRCAGVAERSMAADCKSAGQRPTVVQTHPPAPFYFYRGSNSGVESQPSKLLVAGSIPVSRSSARCEPKKAHVAQLEEHVLGKDGVTSSNLVVGSINVLPRFFDDVGLLPRRSGALQRPKQKQMREAKGYGQEEV
jgi:hypothetical protein